MVRVAGGLVRSRRQRRARGRDPQRRRRGRARTPVRGQRDRGWLGSGPRARGDRRQAERDARRTRSAWMIQTRWADTIVATLADAGVTACVISPGSRSTPLVAALAKSGRLELPTIIDARAAPPDRSRAPPGGAHASAVEIDRAIPPRRDPDYTPARRAAAPRAREVR